MITEDDIQNAQILIVDDDPISLKLLEELFVKGGFLNTTITTDSREVKDLYIRLDPDLIILDLNMPHKNGFDVLHELMEANPEDYLPVVVLTEEMEQSVRFRALQSGAKDFLNKPYDRVEVLLRFRNLIEVHMLHRQIRNQNTLLEGKVKERTRELYETQLDVITRLARAIEYRDSETGLHIVRMSRYSAMVAAQVGLSMDYCDIVLQAAPLHDIGKIGIPDSILQKPGRLTKEEWEIMKTHTTIGAELLSGSNSKFLNVAREIALTHHEHWDGNGYPQGLKGEEIPIVGRICGLCDVFDALMTARPYKEAWSSEKTIEEMRKGRGAHFDPKVLDAFLNILPEIKKIHDRYLDPYNNDG